MSYFARILIKGKWVFFLILTCITVFMALQVDKIDVQYGVPKFLSKNDQAYKEYQYFKEVFGEESTVFILGLDQNPMEDYQLYTKWKRFGDEVEKVWGVDTVVSIAHHLFYFEKDTAFKKLRIKEINTSIRSQKELDSTWKFIQKLPFYKDWIYNEKGSNLMLIQLDKDKFNSKAREETVGPIFRSIEEFEKQNGIDVHISGLPYINTIMRELIKVDFVKFIILSFFICFGIIFLIFKYPAPVLACLLVILTGLAWSIGTTVLMGVKISILTGIIPTLVIVIGIPNCIYLINYFQRKYALSKHKRKALYRTIKEVGLATLLTNLTTAIGFFAFYFTDSEALKEFGLLAAINICFLFIICIIIIPFILSVYPIKNRRRKRKERKGLNLFLDWIINVSQNHKRAIFSTVGVLLIFSVFSTKFLDVSGNLTDDLPKSHFIFDDIRWFEQNFGGIIPLEVYINTHKPNRVTHYKFLKKLDAFTDSLKQYGNLSRGVSVAELIKFAKQGYYNNDPKYYANISSNERVFLHPYLKFEETGNNKNELNAFLDSSKQATRINFFMKDLDAEKMDSLSKKVQQELDEVFTEEGYEKSLTGSSIVFLKGTRYLTKNLMQSIVLAIFVIGVLMAFLFKSGRMIFNALITNLIPLVLTLGFMALLDIAIKPSTILVFSIAFGISVDDTIHFLAKYRIALNTNVDRKVSLIATIREVGASMFFTSVALFFGFVVFVFSDFQGTKALGVLLSFSLLVAMLANLIFLPALLMPKQTKKNQEKEV